MLREITITQADNGYVVVVTQSRWGGERKKVYQKLEDALAYIAIYMDHTNPPMVLPVGSITERM